MKCPVGGNYLHYGICFFPSKPLTDQTCFWFCCCLQEFSTYNNLGQNQFSQYYALPPSYVPAGLPSTDNHAANVGVAGYSAVKSEEAPTAALPSRGVCIILSSVFSLMEDEECRQVVIYFSPLLNGNSAAGYSIEVLKLNPFAFPAPRCFPTREPPCRCVSPRRHQRPR